MTRSVLTYVVNAFSTQSKGGNAAGVVVDAESLSVTDKQAVARQLGLSETAFVLRSEHATVKLEFFTPNRQIADCGHATVASFELLRQLGRITAAHASKETVEAIREIRFVDGHVLMTQGLPQIDLPLTTSEARSAVYQALGLDVAMSAPDVANMAAPQVVSTGVRFMLVPLTDEAQLRTIKPDHSALLALSEHYDLIGVYAFTDVPHEPNLDAMARMFAPRYGIAEESATGMAAGPLACWLLHNRSPRKARYLIGQGDLMAPPSPSRLFVGLDSTEQEAGSVVITGVTVGGSAHIAGEQRIDLP